MRQRRLSFSFATVLFAISAIAVLGFPFAWNSADELSSPAREFFGISKAEPRETAQILAPQAGFTAGNVVVCRVGDGSAALGAFATPVFLDEYTAAGALVQTVSLPIADAGAIHALTTSGTATSECQITNSADGQFVIVPGYDTPPAQTLGSIRTIGRISFSGALDTTTTITSGLTQFRAAASNDGTSFWAVGSSTGVVYQTLGSASAGTVISTTITNNRVANIFGGQLYTSDASGSAVRVGTVGVGLPTTTSQVISNLPGFPTSGSPNNFFLADLTGAVSGVDTLYVADDGSTTGSAGGGVKKFSLVGGSWTYNGTFPASVSPAIPATTFFGLTGSVSGGVVTLFATRPGSAANQIVTFVDTTGYNVTPTAVPTVVATAATNTVFRGVALAPVPPPGINVQGTATGNPPFVNIVNGDSTPSAADGTDFGSVNVSAGPPTTIDRTFNVQNLGTTTLTLTSPPPVLITGPNAADFSVHDQPLFTSLIPGDAVTFTVRFDPTLTGLKTATIQIPNTDPNRNPYTFTIQGTGTADQAPTLTATGLSPTYIAGSASAVNLFSTASTSTVEAGQKLTELDFFLTNAAADGSDNITVDGTSIGLSEGNSGTTATNQFHYAVSKPGSTATVSLICGGAPCSPGVSETAMNSVVNSIAYKSTSGSPTLIVHNVTVSQLIDSGSSTPPNVNTSTPPALNVSTNVTVVADTTQATDFFRSNTASGNWTSASSWQSSHDGVNNWITATAAPTASASGVTIRSTGGIFISTPVSLPNTVIQSSGGIVVFNTGTATITGTLTVNSNGTFQNQGAVVNNGSVSISGFLYAQQSSTFTGSAFSYGAGSFLEYDDNSRTTGNTEFPAVNGPSTVDINTNGAVTLGGPRTIPQQLTLGAGTFDASAGLTLSSGVNIVRSAGNITTAPTFGGPVSVTYFNPVTTGPELPTGPTNLNNLSVGNGPLTVSLAASATVNGTLDMSSNRIATGANTLTIAPAGHVNPGGWVIGNLQQTFTAAGPKTFQIGTTNGPSSVVMNATAGTFPAIFTVSATSTAHPALTDPTKALQRYWTITGTGITANLTFNYLDPPDVPVTATEGNFVIQEFSGGVFTQPGGSVNTAADQATINGVSSFSDWTLAEPSAVGSSPTVTTNAASSVTATAATLNGSANPNGTSATGWFRYSTTNPGTCNDSFGTRAPASGGSSLGSGSSAVPFSQAISGLTTGTPYFFCAIAQNTIGTGFGSVLQFTPTDTTLATDFFRSNTSNGDWTTANSWESSHDGVNNWITATSAPTTSASGVTIRQNHEIQITTAVSLSNTSVGFNATLFVGPTGTATITGSPGLTLGTSGFLEARGTVVNNGSVNVNDGNVFAEFANVSFSGNSFAYSGTNSELQYVGTLSKTTTSTELPSVNGPSKLEINPGSGTITLGSSATITGNLLLDNGTFATGTNLTFGDGCNISRSDGNLTGTPVFAGTVNVTYISAVTAGPELPTSATALNNLSIGATIDLTLPASYKVNGTLALGAGRVLAGANTLSIAGGGNVTRTNGYVIGNLKKTFSAAGSKTFEIGTLNGISAVIVDSASGAFPADVTALATQTAQPNVTDPTKALSRYWTITATGITADLTLDYLDPPDVPGTANESNFVIQKFNSGVFTQPGGSIDTTINQATISGVSINGDWTLAEPAAIGTPGTLQFSSATYSAAENVAGGNLAMSVTRTGGTTGAVGATVTFTNGTATGGASCIAGVDFINTAIPVSFANGSATPFTVNVPLCDDSVFEGNETFTATLGSFTGGATGGATTSATDTINDNETQPSVSISPASVSEGNSGTTTLFFAVTLSNPSSQTVTVHYQTSDGTATTADGDYVATSGTVTIPGSPAPQTLVLSVPGVAVTVNGDTKFEANETMTVTLSSPTNATLGTSVATGTINNDDAAPTISINDVSQSEGNSGTSTFTFTVTQSAISGVATSVNYATADGTATAGSDYVATSGTATIPAGTLSTPISVTVNGDTTFEPDETFFVNLSGGSGYTVAGSDLQGQGTILNDDASPVNMQFSAGTYGAPEGTNVTVVVNRNTSTGTSTVHYATSNGTAMGGACVNEGIDYASTSGTLTFNDGDTFKTFPVTLCNDLFSENPAETLNVTLSSPTGGSLGAQSTATVAIFDVASEFSSNVTLAPPPGGVVSTPITVSGYEGNVLGVRVSLTGVNTLIPDNVDVLLVDPSGTRKYVLMGDTGGSAPFNGVLTFEDMALVHLPDGPGITNGQNYKPTVCAPIADFVGGGAPAGPYFQPGCTTAGDSLSTTFSGFNPNGDWRIYVRDDNGAGLVTGTISTTLSGWGLQFLLPTAAPVSLSGRVLTAGGQGIRNTKVTISGGNLAEPRTVYTGSFGYYNFDGLQVGQAYIVTVESKRYVLAQPSRVVTLLDSLANIDFIAVPRE